MVNYRVITGQFRNFLTDTPYKYGEVKIRLVQNSYTLEAGFPAYNKTIGLDATGHLPVGLEIACNGDFLIPAEYEITEPDGIKWSFTINYDDGSPISVQALRAGGAVPSNPSTVNSLIADDINSKAVRFDIIQMLTNTQKNNVKTALDISSGGGADSPLLLEAHNANELPLKIKAAASHLAKLFSIVNSAGGDLSYFDKDGKLTVPGGSIVGLGNQGLNFSDGAGIMGNAAYIGFSVNGAYKNTILADGNYTTAAGGGLLWAINSDGTTTKDTGLARASAGVVKVTNGSSGSGDLQVGKLYLKDGTVKEVKIDDGIGGKKYLYVDED